MQCLIYTQPNVSLCFFPQVEGHLFRVHRYFFIRESVKFRDMLSMATPNETALMGALDTNAIPLTDVSKEEFESFLWLFYNE